MTKIEAKDLIMNMRLLSTKLEVKAKLKQVIRVLHTFKKLCKSLIWVYRVQERLNEKQHTTISFRDKDTLSTSQIYICVVLVTPTARIEVTSTWEKRNVIQVNF